MSNLLLEGGGVLLLEGGGNLLLESTTVASSYLLLEGTGKLLLEGTGGLLLEVGSSGAALVAIRNETVQVAEAKSGAVTPAPTGVVTRGPLLRFDILTTWAANGGTGVGFLFPEDMGAVTISRGVAGDVRLNLEVPQNPSGAWALVDTGVVLRAIREASDGTRSWEAFLVQEVGDAQRSGVSSVTGVGFLGALAEIGIIEQVDADGTAVSDFDAPGLTPEQHLTTYIVGTATALGLSCVGVGRVEFTTPLPNFAYAGDSPYDALQKLAAAVGGAEYRERWDDTTGTHLIDLVAQVGDISTTSSPDDLGPFGDARAYVNADIDRFRTRITQANVIYPIGADGAKPGGADWLITAKASNVVTVADPDGGAGPLALASQFVGGALRAQDGTLSTITAVNEATQQITVVSGTAFVVGEYATIRSTPAGREVSALLHPASVASKGRVSDTLDRPDLPGTVNLVPNPVGRTWPGSSSAPPTGWPVVGSATITKTSTPGFIQDGPFSIKVDTTGDGNGVSTPLCVLRPTALKPFVSGYFNLYLASGGARVELVLSDGVTSWVVPNGVTQKALVTEMGTFTQLGIRGINAYAAGATSARLRVVQDGAVNTTLYVSAAQLTNTAAFESFFEGNGPRKLHQAGNVAVTLRGPAQVRYNMTLFDVARMLVAGSVPLRAVLGARIRISNDEIGFADAVRIVQMVEDLKVEAQTSVVLSDRPEDMSSLLLSTAPNARAGSAPTNGVVAVAGAARYVDDVVIVSAATGCGSATALFTAADEGLTIWIFGGQANQTILKTTIASVTDGDTAVLAAAAGRSASGLTAIIGTASEVLTLAGGIGGTRAGNALVDNAGKLGPVATDINNRDLTDFFDKTADDLDAVPDGFTYVKRLPLCSLTVTQPSASTTTVTFHVVVGSGETIVFSSMTGVTSLGGGDYQIARAAAGAGPLLYTIDSTRAGYETVSRVVSVPEQAASAAAGPSLEVTTTPGSSNYTITWSGTGTLTVSIDGGTYAAPASSPITVSRNAVSGASKEYAFKAVGADGSTVSNAVTIPPRGAVDTPDLNVVPYNMTPTEQEFTVSATNPSGGTGPTITVYLDGCSGTGTVTGTIAGNTLVTLTSGERVVVYRNAFNAAPATATFKATIASQGSETIQRTILNQDKTAFGPSMELLVTKSTSSYSIAYSGDSVVVSIDGAAFGAPATASPLVVTRDAPGGVDKVYSFKASKDSQDTASVVTIPAQILLGLFTQFRVNPTAIGYLLIEWDVGYVPSGVYFKIFFRNADVNSAPWGQAWLAASGNNFSGATRSHNFTFSTEGISATEVNFSYPSAVPMAMFFRIEMYDGSNVLHSVQESSCHFWSSAYF